MHEPSQHGRADYLIGPQRVDITVDDGIRDGTSFVHMRNYAVGSAVFSAVLANGATCTCQLLEATDATGTGAAAISGKSSTLTGDGSTPQGDTIDFNEFDLTNPNTYYVGVRMTCDTTNDEIACTLFRLGARYKGADIQAD